MSAFGTSTPLLRAPWGLVKPWALPHPRSPRGRGCRRRLRQPLHPNHRALGRLQPVKAKPLRGCFASLDRFPAPSASDRFATPKEMERVKGDAVVHFTLDALESTQHSAQGNVDRFCHMPLRPPEVSGVWGKAPRSFFWFWLGKLKITPKKKVQFMSNFRMLTTKNTLNSAFLMPTPR